jgi:chromosome segregation ATPase
VEAEIRLVEAISEVDSLKIENQHINQRIETLENTIRTLQTRKDALVKEYTRINRDTQRLLRTISEEEKVIMAEFSSLPTLEDLANEIEAVNTRLQLMAEGNPHAVQAYENREREIEQKESTLEKIAESLETTRAQIQGIRGQWEPELDKLVDQISRGFAHNFEQIGCAGQVGVHKDEDFEKWSIQIQVRFR